MVPPIDDNSLMPFGKYKGYAMVNVPPDYLRWCWDNITTLRPDIKDYIQRNLDVIDWQIARGKKQIRR